MTDIRSLLMPEETARALSITQNHLRKLAKTGIVPSVRIGGRWRFRRVDVEKILGETLHPRMQHADEQASEQ